MLVLKMVISIAYYHHPSPRSPLPHHPLPHPLPLLFLLPFLTTSPPHSNNPPIDTSFDTSTSHRLAGLALELLPDQARHRAGEKYMKTSRIPDKGTLSLLYCFLCVVALVCFMENLFVNRIHKSQAVSLKICLLNMPYIP